MRSAFTVAAGLVATTSAANLRSKTTVDKATLMTIQGLAEKYDCATGGKSLESVLQEISSANVESLAKLESECYAGFNDMNAKLSKAEADVHDRRVSAIPNADKNMRNKIEGAKSSFDALNAKHADAVKKADSHSEQMQEDFEQETESHKASNIAFDTEVVSLKNDRLTAAEGYKAMIAQAIANLKEERRLADIVFKNSIAASLLVKTADDAACEATFSAHKEVIASDQETVNALSDLVDELEGLKGDTVRGRAALLEIRERVHANYNDLLSKKGAAITEWNTQCTTNLKTFETELSTANAAADKLRDTTEGLNNAAYKLTMSGKDGDSGADGVLREVVNRHLDIVDGLQTTFNDLENAYLGESGTDQMFNAALLNFKNVEGVVATERAEALATQTTENKNTETTKTDLNEGYAKFEQETVFGVDGVGGATGDHEAAIEECKASFMARSELIEADQKMLVEISGLMSQLKACKGVTDDTMLLETEASKSLESASCAAAAERYTELTKQTSLLETTEDPSSTSGNLNAFKDRVGQEQIEASRVQSVCNAAADTVLSDAKEAALTLKNTRTVAANKAAALATGLTNGRFDKTTVDLNTRFSAAEDPMKTARKNNSDAKAKYVAATDTLGLAKGAQAAEVEGAKKIHSDIKADADELRKNNIAEDKAQATKDRQAAVSSHATKTTDETELCDTESAALSQELTKLGQVVEKMKTLQAAHKGLTDTDKSTMATDVLNMKDQLNKERERSVSEKTACDGAALKLQTETDAATDKLRYDVKDNEFKATKTKADAESEAFKTSKFNAHGKRQTVNEQMWATANQNRNQAEENNKLAKAAHVTAKAVQSEEMGSEYAEMAEINRKAPIERQREIDTEYSVVAILEKEKIDEHSRMTKEKEVLCSDERRYLKEERDTLKVTAETINELTAVRTNAGNGAAHDYAATTTQAPTWERL